jgi:phosphoadenosine phosphosulfate reductase
MTAMLTDAALADLSASFEQAPAEEVVRWAADTFGDRLCLTTSLTDAVLVDLAARVAPGIEVVFLDTQYHFPETLATLAAVEARYPVRLNVRRPDRALDDLWRVDPDGCCHARKVVPLEAALVGKEAWLSGLRRADSPERAGTPIVQRDRRGLVKVNPMATWSDDDVRTYVHLHDVVVNPLVARGYPSVGCWPCTRAVAAGEEARAGRWAGTAKTECGLHL